MSHEIKLHEAQMSILRELLFLPAAGFAELQKPTGLTSDHFTFHINRLMEIGLVERKDRGQYTLTTAGKEFANRLDTDEHTVERQAKLCVLVATTRKRTPGVTEYLIQQRLKQPFYGKHGFMTGKLRWGENVLIGGARELLEETNLNADLRLAGIWHKIDHNDDGRLLEDKHFFVIHAQNPRGELAKTFDGGANFWYTKAEIEQLDNKFDSMFEVMKAIEQPNLTFWEKTYVYPNAEY
jgi:ADP-ribose pyrophosphatase YjhB (NUDIX family)/predicted transcriptional regulator